MSETLKPCPLCGGTDLKHYVTNARGRNRGVIVCKRCGLRLEAYSDEEYKVAQAYYGDFKSAHEFTWEQARDAVADKWNSRAGRTCRVVSAKECGGVGYAPGCSECGWQMAGSMWHNYCPNCGARVLDEEVKR